MLDVLKTLNEDNDRSVIIGRNALNLLCTDEDEPGAFRTNDFDLVCPNIEAANECRAILEAAGFQKMQATFIHPQKGEIDILIADPKFPPESVVEGYFNLPTLRPLWDAREKNKDGIILPAIDDLIMNKLHYLRENDGRDAEAVSIYFELNPDKLDSMLDKIKGIENNDARDKILYALYESVATNDVFREKVELVILDDLERQKEIVLDKGKGKDDKKLGERDKDKGKAKGVGRRRPEDEKERDVHLDKTAEKIKVVPQPQTRKMVDKITNAAINAFEKVRQRKRREISLGKTQERDRGRGDKDTGLSL